MRERERESWRYVSELQDQSVALVNCKVLPVECTSVRRLCGYLLGTQQSETITYKMEGAPVEFWLKRPSDANKGDTKLCMSPRSTLADVKVQVHKKYDDRPDTGCITVSREQLYYSCQCFHGGMSAKWFNSSVMCMRCAVDPWRESAEG